MARMRCGLFLMASSQVWVPRRFDESVIRETAGRFLVTLRNVYSRHLRAVRELRVVAVGGGSGGGGAAGVGSLGALAPRGGGSRSGCALARFDATAAARVLMDFVSEDVANWYVRLSARGSTTWTSDDNRAAFATLHEVLVVTCRLLAPFAPYVSDWIHHELTGTSVHLASFRREGTGGMRDEGLERAMSAARTLATLGRSARESAGIKVRQPLGTLTCVGPRCGHGLACDDCPDRRGRAEHQAGDLC
jgi:isoleucyl-tRNA synthetase